MIVYIVIDQICGIGHGMYARKEDAESTARALYILYERLMPFRVYERFIG